MYGVSAIRGFRAREASSASFDLPRFPISGLSFYCVQAPNQSTISAPSDLRAPTFAWIQSLQGKSNGSVIDLARLMLATMLSID